jgi:hypothetical protein
MPGCQVNAHIKRINKLISVVNYRRFSHELFLYLSDAANMAFMKTLLIETYFPAKANEFVGRKAGGVGCCHDPEAYLLNVQEAGKKQSRSKRRKKSMCVAVCSSGWCHRSTNRLARFRVCSWIVLLDIHL